MRKSWLTKNLLLLSAVSLTQDAASELLYPLMPLIIASLVGSAPLLIGVIEGIAEATAGLTKLFSGKAADRFGAKPFVIAGYSIAGVGKALVVAAVGWPMVLAGRMTDRLGKGMRSAPRDALIGVGIKDENLGKAFGFHRMSDTIGAVVGPLIALLGLAMLNNDVRAVALWALIPALLSALLTLFIKSDNRPKATRAESAFANKTPLPAGLKRNIALLAVIQLANIPDALLLLRLHELGFNAVGMVLSYVLFNLIAAAAALPAGYIADRVHPAKVYAIGLCIFAVSYATLGLTNNVAVAVVAVAVYGLFPALTDGVGKSWVSKQAPAAIRGKAQGWYQALMNFAILAAGIWGGLFWGKGENQPVLVVAAVISGLGALALWLAKTSE
jgi:MFS family permease